jgi:FkbM family methyltransferase
MNREKIKQVFKKVFHRFGYDVIRLHTSNENIENHLANIFSKLHIDCVLDVGANSGQYAKTLRLGGYGGYIISFEPVKRVFEKLEYNCREDDKWLCYNLALGDTTSLQPLNVFSSTVFSSFLKVATYSKSIWNSLDTVEQEIVQVRRLDELLPEIQKLTGCKRFFLKMDTQGYDHNVFRGASGAVDVIYGLQSELALIPVYEDMLNPYDVLNEFHRDGFYISGMYPVNRDESLAVIEYDCIMVKANIL